MAPMKGSENKTKLDGKVVVITGEIKEVKYVNESLVVATSVAYLLMHDP